MPITDEMLSEELNEMLSEELHEKPEIELWVDADLLKDDGVDVENVCKQTDRKTRTETFLECIRGHAGVYHTDQTVFERKRK